MTTPDPDSVENLAWLRDQVDRAVPDVRRSECTIGAATALGVLCGSLPVLLFLVVVVLNMM
ncbi:hypothetical protein ACFQH9_17210 [Pseudonocardia lutea]|uniref:Uncharacterized protein n=1 Tax=Pseudonocardia lutea TaxID=2172015 RepID=A0ABW1ICP0_9PSEU